MSAHSDSQSCESPAKWRFRSTDAWRLAIHIGVVLAAIASITFVCWRLIPANATTAGFAYLIAILVIAAGWGLVEALVASIASVLCFNYFFFEPVHTFNIAEPENWVALFAFLVTSLVASQLSAQARQRAQDALESQRELAMLYALSRAILLIDVSASPGRYIAHQIQNIFGFSSVVLFDSKGGEIHHAGSNIPAALDELLRQSATGGKGKDALAFGYSLTPIALGGEFIGSLAVEGSTLSDAASLALANLVAVALEKVRSQEAANRAEAARQSEELKSTLLDSLAHEFKTPLTSAKAAATALLPLSSSLPEGQRELISIIDEEVDRLTHLITEATEMARIEAGELRLRAGQHSAGKLVDIALEKMEAKMEGRNVSVQLVNHLPEILVDPDMVALALGQLLDNAMKYSPPASPIAIGAESMGRKVVISVTDQGPGIPEAERKRVFEKFYRSPNTRQHILGTGMGLAIAREIVSAHGGEIGVDSNPGGGSRFWISLPVVEEKRSA